MKTFALSTGALLVIASAAQATFNGGLVDNGSFEINSNGVVGSGGNILGEGWDITGSFSTGTVRRLPVTNVLMPANNYPYVNSPFTSPNGPDDAWIFINGTHNGTNLAGIDQVLTAPAGSFHIEFWLQLGVGATPNATGSTAAISLGDVPILNQTYTPTTSFGWTKFSVDLDNVPENPDLVFAFNTGNSGGNPSGQYFFFDAISVTQTPAPTSAAFLGLGGLMATRRRRA